MGTKCLMKDCQKIYALYTIWKQKQRKPKKSWIKRIRSRSQQLLNCKMDDCINGGS